MVSDQRSQSKTVCVIGAGPSGLVAARELRRELHKVVVMEQSHDIGGQWLYSSDTRDEVPLARYFSTDSVVVPRVHSSVYASLRLTSPREIMGYTDFPFATKKGRDMRRFPGHRELFLYLKDFCEWFGLRELIRFDTKVEYVGMADNGCRIGEDLKWVVRSRAVAAPDATVVEEIFDAVVVATGHYTQPRLPKIKGMDSWRRRQIHSHTYRVPIPFRDEVVVIVGNSLSGQDISMELVEVAKQVHLSSKTLDVTEGLSRVISKHKTLHLHPQIDRLCDDGRVVFVDGSCVEADTIIYCTGYSYSFPFLDAQGIITVDDDRVGPLYEHTFPPSLAPSLSFIGIPRKVTKYAFPFLFPCRLEVEKNIMLGAWSKCLPKV
uniref:Flavin-containing monooxygenase n=1 Tax=Kalanchoe fedtschenkoi TaxID=63787 RepID=A0A7N0TN90_KALFE